MIEKKEDNSKNTGQIDVNDSTAVEELHQQWKQFSREEIRKAIEDFGPDIAKIDEYLKGHAAAE